MGEKLYEILGMESCQMSLYVEIPQLDEKMPHCHQQPAVKIEIPNDTGGVVFRWHPASVYVQEDDGVDHDNMMMMKVVCWLLLHLTSV